LLPCCCRPRGHLGSRVESRAACRRCLIMEAPSFEEKTRRGQSDMSRVVHDGSQAQIPHEGGGGQRARAPIPGHEWSVCAGMRRCAALRPLPQWWCACRAGCWLLAACALCASLAGPAWLRALAKQNRISALAEEWEGAPPADCPGPGSSCLAALTLHASTAASVPRCFWPSPVRCLSPQSYHHIPHKTTSASNISSLIFSGALNSSGLRGRPRQCLVAWSGMAGNIIPGGLVAGMEGVRPWGMNGWKVLLAAKSTFAAPPWPKGAGPDLALCSRLPSPVGPQCGEADEVVSRSVLPLSVSVSLPARPALSLLWLHWCSPLPSGHCPGAPRACRTLAFPNKQQR